MLLFKSRCLSSDGEETVIEGSIENGGAGNDYELLKLRVSNGSVNEATYRFVEPVSAQAAEGGTFEASLVVADAAPFSEGGLLGFRPTTANLHAVRLVVRSADRDGYSSKHPYFALYLDWAIEAAVQGGSEFADGSLEASANAQLILTTGFSCIHPWQAAWEQGARALQLRLDLDFMAATTGWFPLPLIDAGSGLPFSMPGLGEWFRRLTGGASEGALPNWTADLRLPMMLPLGLRFERSHLSLIKEAGGYQLEALARGLVLDWRGELPFQYSNPEAEFSLLFADGTYQFTAVLFAVQNDENKPVKASLPFGALTLTAEACRSTAGLFAHGDPLKVCPDLVLEMAGVRLASELWAKGKPLWQSKALRLHLRGRSLLTCEVAGGKLLFEGLAADNWLAGYRDANNPRVERLSGGAADDDAEPEDSFAIDFLDGAFDRDGYVRLLWRQNTERLLERLASLVPGLKPQSGGDDGAGLYVGLELARFDGPDGRDLQARLEWRSAGEPSAPASSALPPQAPAALPAKICSKTVGDTFVLNLPVEGAAPPERIADPAVRLDLPLVEVAIAKPSGRSLLFYRPAGEAATLSLLHIYRKDPADRVLPIVHASVDLSLSDGDEQELLPTQNVAANAAGSAGPFLSVGLGSRAEVQAIAVVTWRDGTRPQIVRAFDGDGEPFRSLIPPDSNLPDSDGQDCASCPVTTAPEPAPVALHPDRFGTPDVATASAGWNLAVQIAAKRALRSFLSEGGSDSFIEISVREICYDPAEPTGGGFLPPLLIRTSLTIKLNMIDSGGDTLSGDAVFRFDPSDLSLRLVEGGVFHLELAAELTPPAWAGKLEFPIEPDEHVYSKVVNLFGLEATFYRKEEARPAKARFLTLDLRAGRFALGLAEGTRCVLRYSGFGEDDALTFSVDTFLFGPGGLDVEAALVPSPLKVRGLSNPFQLESAQLSMRGSRLRRLSVSANGKLPEILSNTPVAVTLTLAQKKAGGLIDLEELSCELRNGDEPIFTSGLRYRFEISALSLRYARDPGAGGRHFFFEVTGSAQFTPKENEFDGGLLENLKSARIEFMRAPLSDEFAEHLTFMVELNEPVTFSVFKIFRMEIRSFGFAPQHDFPEEDRPALIIGGQVEFGDIGDVVSAEIDFHRMYIGLPARRRNKPQVEFKNLRVEIRTETGFRIGGTVASYDEPNKRGFEGDGFVAIPGFPQLGAAFAFMELRHPEGGGWKRAWFIAVEASRISYQLAPLPIFIRHAGMGVGYRKSSGLLRERPADEPLADRVQYLLSALDKHQTLARIESWDDDVERPGGSARWSVAMEGVFTLGSSQPDPVTYDQEKEQKLRTIVLQLMAAMNVNGLVAGAKVWFPVSYDDFLNDRLAMRRRPMAKGFVHFAPREQRLLTYARKEKNAYYGPPDDPLTRLAQTILEPVPYEYAALVEPGRVRGEIGWADRLVFQIQLGLLRIECRGGILYAVEKNTAVFGVYLSARGGLGLSGGAGGGSLGLRVSARADVKFATRLMIAQPLLRPIGSSVYAQVGIDINVRFSVDAWFKFKVGFVKVSLSLSFSVTLQVLVALEIGLADADNLGFKARATVVISVFGRRLRASIAVGVNEGAVNLARQRLSPYMSSMLEPGKIPPVPGDEAGGGQLIAPAPLADLALGHAALLLDVPETGAGEDFAFAVIPLEAEERRHGVERHWLLWIMPTPSGDGFYPVPIKAPGIWADLTDIPDGSSLYALDESGKWAEGAVAIGLYCDAGKPFDVEAEGGPVPEGEDRLTLRTMMAGCYRPVKSRSDFPFDYADGDMLDPVEPDFAEEGSVEEDQRIPEGPRHADPVLNPTNPFDSALAASMDHNPGESDPVREQALGYQAFLIKSFREDIKKFVAGLAGSDPLATTPRGTKPSVWDTGMMLLLKGTELPDWVRTRDQQDAQDSEKAERPKLKFRSAQIHQSSRVRSPSVDRLMPILEPVASRMSEGNIQLARPPVAHFDEELLQLSWTLAWSARAPLAAPGIGTEVEDCLDHYRVELYGLGASAAQGGERPLVQRLVMPATLLAKEGKDERQELKRYSFTIPVDELFPKGSGTGQRSVLAVVTPVGEAGEEGESFSVTATQVLRLTPLPADGASLELKALNAASLEWQEPALPNRAAVAATDQWELVLRKLPQVPLGHYPQAGENGGAMSSQHEMRAGDLIVRMEKGTISSETGSDGGRRFKLALPAGIEGKDREWLDHEGNELSETLEGLKQSFIGRKSAAEGGHAWQLFLRARHAPQGYADATYSTLQRVWLSAVVQKPQSDDDEPAKHHLPLQHFEWPSAVPAPELRAPEVTAGRLHVPLPSFAEDAGPHVRYCPSGDAQRVVSATWAGAPSGRPLASSAGFHLFEATEDARTNKDASERETPAGSAASAIQAIASFDAVDPQIGGSVPDTLADTSNWRSWSPAHANMLEWLSGLDGERPDMIADVRRSWFSWSDADLVWPPNASLARTAAEPAPALVRENLHPLLEVLLSGLKSDWADPQGFVLEAATGAPDTESTTHLEWLQRNTEALDPYGWAALWHLGLAVELSARDAVSGFLVPQSRLIAHIEEQLVDLLKREEFADLGPHIALDCPLRPNAGLAAEDFSRPLDDLALRRVQVALRPLARKRAEYCIVTAPDGHRPPKEMPAVPSEPAQASEWGVEVLRVDVAPERVLPIAHQAIADVLRQLLPAGGRLLVKFPEERRSDLERILDGMQLRDFVKWVPEPLSLGSSDGSIWPHGRFPVPDKPTTPGDPGFMQFISYLYAAPLAQKIDGVGTSRDSTVARPVADPESQAYTDIQRKYQDWARRFFASAPLPDDESAGFRFSERNVATAAPRSEGVDVLSPARDGTFSYNRLVNWQWATTRSLSVVAVGRYDRLLEQIGVPALSEAERARNLVSAPAAPFHLPRVRKLEAPQLVGERLVRAEDGRDYHELTFAIHEEDALQQANLAVDRQLEFRGAWARWRREFRFPDWAGRREWRDDRGEGGPGLPLPKLRWSDEPRFSDSDRTFLGSVPVARFGSTAVMVRCEPYYYGTVAELWAVAAQLESNMVERPLAYAPADAALPESDPLLLAERQVRPWTGLMASRHEAWEAALESPLDEALSRWQARLRVRFPRFFESLRGTARAEEGEGKFVGALADFEASLQLTRRTAGADEPICLFRPDQRTDAPPFELLELSTDLTFESETIIPRDWQNGVVLDLAIRPEVEEPSVSVAQEPVLATGPLPRAQEDQLFQPRSLPAWGPLAALAPVALRLLFDPAIDANAGGRLQFVDPVPISRAMGLPLSTDSGGALELRPGELALTLRLLLDSERMAAAKAAAYIGHAISDLELRMAIEQAPAAACRKPDADDLPDRWARWQEAGLPVWGLRETDGALGWVRLDQAPGPDITLLIASLPEWSAGAEAAYASFLSLRPVGESALTWDIAAIKSAGALARQLATVAEPQVERARRLEPDAEALTFWVQRGNEPRTFWGGRKP